MTKAKAHLVPKDTLDPDLSKKARRAIGALYRRFRPRAREVWCGRNRVVFDMGTYVIKLPRHPLGFGDNEWEGSFSNVEESHPDYDPDGIQYARTRLFYYAGLYGVSIPVVFMEKVYPDSPAGMHCDSLPDWVMSVDSGQVGYNKRGKLVAFDYGYN